LAFFFCAIVTPCLLSQDYILLLSHTASLAPAGDRLLGAAPGPSVGASALSPDRQAVEIPDAAVAANNNKTLNITVEIMP